MRLNATRFRDENAAIGYDAPWRTIFLQGLTDRRKQTGTVFIQLGTILVEEYPTLESSTKRLELAGHRGEPQSVNVLVLSSRRGA